MHTSGPHTLQLLLDSCVEGNRASQKELYRQFYAYGMNICLHYAKNREEAQEILNDGFLRAFRFLHQFDRRAPFKSWLRRILINAAIDYFRQNMRAEKQALSVAHLQQSDAGNTGWDQLLLDDALAMLQQLPPSYRLVFNLYVVEGLTHPEIAKQLGITVGASKSNLSKARARLQELVAQWYPGMYKTK